MSGPPQEHCYFSKQAELGSSLDLLGRVVQSAVLDELVNSGHVLVNQDVADDVDHDNSTDDDRVLRQEGEEDDGADRLAKDDERGNHRGALQVDARGDSDIGEGRTGEGAEVQVGDHEDQAANEGLQDVAVRASDEGLDDVGNGDEVEHGQNQVARKDKGHNERGGHQEDTGDEGCSLAIAGSVVDGEVPLTVSVTSGLHLLLAGLGDRREGTSKDAGDLGEDSHDGSGCDAAGCDLAPGSKLTELVEVTDDTDEQAEEEAEGHGLTDEAELLAQDGGVGVDLVQAELVEQQVQRHGEDAHGSGVQGGDGAVGITIVVGPTLSDNLGAEQGVELLDNHASHGEPEVAGQNEQAGAPCEVGIVVPKVAGLEDRGVVHEVQDDLKSNSDRDVDHTNLIGVSDDRGGLPAKVNDRQVDAHSVDHVVDNRRQDRAIGANDQREALKANACRQGREEGLLGLNAHCQSNNKIKTGTNTAALNVVKNMFKAFRNASMPSPFM